MVLRIPPPPFLTGQLQPLNRWLLEIQNILNSQGTIDPDNVDGLPALFTQVAELAAEITTLTAEVTALNTQVTANTAAIAANATAIATLQANAVVRNGVGVPAVGLGNNGDLYINNTGSAGTNLYAKIGGVWVAFA